MELGDIDGVDIQIAAASKLAEALHRPIWLWWTSLFRGARAQLAGQFDEAERLAQETLAIGQRGQAENALHYYAQAMFNIRREQGRLAEVEGAVRGFIELYPAIPAWRGALALLLVELGRPDEARAEFERVSEGGFAAFPRDANWLIAITLMAEVCGALGDAARAGELYRAARALRGPQRRRGPQRHLQRLGVAAARHPRRRRGASYELAEGHFEEAQAMHARDGRPAVARAHAGVVRGDAAAARRGPRGRDVRAGRGACWPTRAGRARRRARAGGDGRQRRRSCPAWPP